MFSLFDGFQGLMKKAVTTTGIYSFSRQQLHSYSVNIPAFVQREPQFPTQGPNSDPGIRLFPHLSRPWRKSPDSVSKSCDSEWSTNHSCFQAWHGLNWESESNRHLTWAFISRIWLWEVPSEVIFWINFSVRFLVKFGGRWEEQGFYALWLEDWWCVFKRPCIIYVEGNNGKYKKILLLPDGDHFFDNGTEQAPMRNCHFSVALFELVMCTSLVSTCFVLYRSFDGLLEVGLSKCCGRCA